MLSNKEILVIGDVMLDEWIFTEYQKISQETHVPVNRLVNRYSQLGGAGNAARICKYLTDDRIHLISIVGEDSYAEEIKIFAETEQIEGIFFIDISRPTTRKMRIYSQEEPLIRIDEENCSEINVGVEGKIIKEVERLSPILDGILLSDYGKGMLTQRLIQEILMLSKKYKIPVVADPAKHRVQHFKGCSVIKPNSFEWTTFLAKMDNPQQDWNSILECPLIVITKSEQGFDYYENGIIKSLPGIKVSEIDVTGAGDSAAAALISGLIRGKSTEDFLKVTNEIAAKFVTFERTEFPEKQTQQISEP